MKKSKNSQKEKHYYCLKCGIKIERKENYCSKCGMDFNLRNSYPHNLL